MTIAYPRSLVGFDRIFNEFERAIDTKPKPQYPPHNLVKLEDGFLLEFSIAGYNPDHIEVSLEDGNVLVVKTKDDHETMWTTLNNIGDNDFIHRGISGRSFVRKFTLHEYLQVEHVNVDFGILHIKLTQVIPEEKKPRVFDIGYANDSVKQQQLLSE